MPSERDEARTLTVVQALREALLEEMQRDERVFLMGEDIRPGGSFSFTLGMLETFGPERVVNTPISESGFIGLGIGAAIQGMRPVVDFQYGDFLFSRSPWSYTCQQEHRGGELSMRMQWRVSSSISPGSSW
jgi:pyruvate dehydrogenase E1 component beta subunit